MNLQRIRYFLAVIDHGTVTAAAEVLHVAQPALSRQLKTLEQEVGVRLFSHVSNRLVPTSAALAFVPHARVLLQQEKQTRLALETIRSGEISSLVMAATSHTAQGLLAPFIRTHAASGPVLVCQERGHFELIDSLHQDADFIVTPVAPPAGYAHLALPPAPIFAYTAIDHLWAQEELAEVRLEKMLDETLFAHAESSVSRQVLNAAFAELGNTPKSIVDCDSADAALALAALGRGVAITSLLPAYPLHQARILAPVSPGLAAERQLGIKLFAAWLPDHYAADAIARLAGSLRRFSATSMPTP